MNFPNEDCTRRNTGNSTKLHIVHVMKLLSKLKRKEKKDESFTFVRLHPKAISTNTPFPNAVPTAQAPSNPVSWSTAPRVAQFTEHFELSCSPDSPIFAASTLHSTPPHVVIKASSNDGGMHPYLQSTHYGEVDNSHRVKWDKCGSMGVRIRKREGGYGGAEMGEWSRRRGRGL
jgi:hypothetical protein